MKHTLKLILLILIAWTWLPTGPTDFFIIPFIVSKIGMTGYIIGSIILVYLLFKTIEGKGIGGKFKTVGREIKQIFS
jgi:hypothetical protein